MLQKMSSVQPFQFEPEHEISVEENIEALNIKTIKMKKIAEIVRRDWGKMDGVSVAIACRC